MLREAGREIPIFVTVDQARAYAQRADLWVEADVGAHTYDLDAVRTWCQDPSPDILDAAQLFMIWKLLEDAGLAKFPNALPGEPDYATDQLATWLGTHMTGTDERPPGWEPHQWTSDEARALADVLRSPLEQFFHELRVAAA